MDMATRKFQNGERVFDSESGDFGTVLHYASGFMVLVDYDHAWGTDMSVAEADEAVLRCANETA